MMGVNKNKMKLLKSQTLFLLCDLKLSLRFEKLHLVFIHSHHLVSFLLICVFLVVAKCCISIVCEPCLNLLPSEQMWLG